MGDLTRVLQDSCTQYNQAAFRDRYGQRLEKRYAASSVPQVAEFCPIALLTNDRLYVILGDESAPNGRLFCPKFAP
jgi:hypothetical protein